MPNANWGLYLTGGEEGTEVSSTYEGRHITMTAAELITDGGSGVAVKGHACVFGLTGLQAVGVCFNSGTTTDLIAVDTEGIWNLPVDGDDDNGNTILYPGQAVFINTATCVISGIRNNATQIPFGYLLTQVASAGNDVISVVKVHWDPRSHWLEDQEMLYFGDAWDVSVEWDGNNLEMLPLVNDTGAFNIGNGTLSMDVQIFGMNAATSLLWDSSAGTLDLENTVLAPSDRALSVNIAMALPQGEGFLGFFEGTLSGQQAGLTYGLYSWLTLGATFVATATVTTPLETGIYGAAGADLTLARLIFGAQHQCHLDSVPASYYPWRINVGAALGSITALIQAGNIQSVGYIAAVTENDPPIGYIPLAFIAGIAAAQPCYVRVYADTD